MIHKGVWRYCLLGTGMLAGALHAQVRENPATDWFHAAKMGAFMHFLPGVESFGRVELFDVEALAGQLQAAGAGYLVFTLGQNSGYLNAPNPVYDRIAGYGAGERCARRDLPMELGRALAARGIRLMLYLPCQTPNRDLQAVTAFGFPAAEVNRDRRITPEGSQRWSEVIAYWSEHYGRLVSGWWFDGGYAWVQFDVATSALYAAAAKRGNPEAIVSFNPGVRLSRASDHEDYTAGELNEPLRERIASRWLDGSQAHVLTYMGDTWGRANCRYRDDEWLPWLRELVAKGGVLSMDMAVNVDPGAGPIGIFVPEQMAQFQRLAQAAATVR